MSQKTRPTAGIQKARTLALKGNGYVDLKYGNEAALAETHRSSPEYKTMRKVSAEHNLWGKVLPEVVLMKAIVPEAFIHKGTPASGQKQGEDDAFVVISEYTSPDASMEKLVDEIRKLTKASWQEANVLSYYPITQKDNTSSTILVFEQYPSEDDYQAVTKKQESLRSNVANLAANSKSTTWTNRIGYVGK
ncbi:hypothetical protein PV05_04902 [Exophiala xenobiotica]|uniref:ABM domain-containing protein n=1 Tax=Exophiala xenobiotica TaxID=348802 RepID=A0A0D2F848_9EURO|nr:uncharacterized protein PV05_04902 [Exophiala xenobiotica]KIW56224.1 hypothetical protein PV05_04902 [Exophiala xenobiotica]